jgi:hypothetical protein
VVEGLAIPAGVEGRIYDWMGRLETSMSPAGENRFALGRNLEPGIYFTVVEIGGRRHSLRWLKE